MNLSTLRPNEGSRKVKKRIGRGPGSGNGTTAGKGNKGQQSRSGYKRSNREGGQMPLHRRLPKFGFTKPNRVSVRTVSLEQLDNLVQKGLLGSEISLEDFKKVGLISRTDQLKVLGDGELSSALKLTVHACSQSAKEKIEKAGGTIEIAYRTLEEADRMRDLELDKALKQPKVTVAEKKKLAKKS
jgi:large subunit ribosomal protein L15